MLYNLHFSPSKCRLFHNATLFGFCITHILNTGCAKIWKKVRRQKVNFYPNFVHEQSYLWRFRREKTVLLTIEIYVRQNLCAVLKPPFFLTLISTVGLQLYSLYWGERITLVMWHWWWREKSHSPFVQGKRKEADSITDGDTDKEILLNSIVKQYVNRISVPAAWRFIWDCN